MKKNRVWMEIVILGTAMAFALALLFATLGAAAGVAEGEVSRQQQMPPTADQTNEGQAYEGMVTSARAVGRSMPPASVNLQRRVFEPVYTEARPSPW